MRIFLIKIFGKHLCCTWIKFSKKSCVFFNEKINNNTRIDICKVKLQKSAYEPSVDTIVDRPCLCVSPKRMSFRYTRYEFFISLYSLYPL